MTIPIAHDDDLDLSALSDWELERLFQRLQHGDARLRDTDPMLFLDRLCAEAAKRQQTH